MAIIKKAISISGEEYQRLKQIEAAYNASVEEQPSEAEAKAETEANTIETSAEEE